MLLALVGDVMLGRGVAEEIACRAPESFWGDTLPLLRQADLVVAGLWNGFCWLARLPCDPEVNGSMPIRRSTFDRARSFFNLPTPMKTGGLMKYGNITVNLNRVPVEVSILVEGRQRSGAFISNRERRGIRIADERNQIDVTADDALLLLAWLQEQAPALRAMLDEEAAALAAVDQRGAE